MSPLNTFQSSLAMGSTKTLRRRCPGGLRSRAAMESGGHIPCRYPGGSRGRAALSRAESRMVLATGRSGGPLSPLGTPLMLPRVVCVQGWGRCRGPAEPTHHQRGSGPNAPHPPRPWKSPPEEDQSIWQSSPPQKGPRGSTDSHPHTPKGNPVPNRPPHPQRGARYWQSHPSPTKGPRDPTGHFGTQRGPRCPAKHPLLPKEMCRAPHSPKRTKESHRHLSLSPEGNTGAPQTGRAPQHPTKGDPGAPQTPFPQREHGHRQSLLRPQRAPWISQSPPSLPKRTRRAPPPPKGNPGVPQSTPPPPRRK